MSAGTADRPVEVLFLRLEGPLMAWGEAARWSVRETRPEPTKSGVIGLLAACLGLGTAREDDRRIAELARATLLGIRVDRPGLVIRDYHTVVGGVLSAEGKVKRNQNSGEAETVVSERYYLSDACFLAALASRPEVLDRLEEGLREPVWPPFLGRRSCPTAVPVYPALPGCPSRGRYRGLLDALESFPYIGRGAPDQPLRTVIELEPGGQAPEGSIQRRRDVPFSLAGRQFGYRYVYETRLTPPEASPGRGHAREV